MKTFIKPLLFSSAILFSLGAWAQTSEEAKMNEKPTKKHLKIVKVENGVTSKLDTVITDAYDFKRLEDCEFDDFFWDGNRGIPPEFPDSLMEKHMKHLRFEGHHGHGPEVFIHRGPGEFDELHEFKFNEGDSTRQMVFIHKGDHSKRFMHFGDPGMPQPPHPIHLQHLPGMDNPDVIDLNAPGVISFKKKDLSGGREKIEIIRKKPEKKKVEVEKGGRMKKEDAQ